MKKLHTNDAYNCNYDQCFKESPGCHEKHIMGPLTSLKVWDGLPEENPLKLKKTEFG